jgi:cyanate permease
VDIQIVIRIFGYFVATASFFVGIAVIVGFILPAYIPEQFRIVVGVVMVLYGIYRTTMLLIKQRYAKNSEE